MKLFSKIRKGDASIKGNGSRLEKAFNEKLLKVAGYLQARTTALPVKVVKTILVMFCLTWGCLSLYLILSAFGMQDRSLIFIQRIQLPKYYQRTGEEGLKVPSSTISPDRSNIRLFIDSMKTLSASAKSRWVYDSIITSRPHLLDSIGRLEQLESKQK